MRRGRQPLGQTNDVFEPGLLGGHRESDRALNHVRIVRRTIVGAPDTLQRVGDSLGIAHVGDGDLGALRLQPRAAVILPPYHGADRIAGAQQLRGDNGACFPGGASDEDLGQGHGEGSFYWSQS